MLDGWQSYRSTRAQRDFGEVYGRTGQGLPRPLTTEILAHCCCGGGILRNYFTLRDRFSSATFGQQIKDTHGRVIIKTFTPLSTLILLLTSATCYHARSSNRIHTHTQTRARFGVRDNYRGNGYRRPAAAAADGERRIGDRFPPPSSTDIHARARPLHFTTRKKRSSS